MKDDNQLERDRYVHFVQTVNWAIVTTAVIIGYFVLNGFFPHILIVALVAITAANMFVLMNRFEIVEENNE